MPKDRRDRSVSSTASPYTCSSRRSTRSSSKNPTETVEDAKEWEEARCPVCMEHPHNAVLLLCSSHGKGCRPYMCDTSYRHSNCLDQFRKSSGEALPDPPQEASQVDRSPHHVPVEAEHVDLQGEISEGDQTTPQHPCDNQIQLNLACPLCRGQVNGWVVVEPARRFMNDKARICACETCDFSGTYADLRKHARLSHPLVRPSEADPQRQNDWTRLERERDLGDVLSTIQSAFAEERGENGMLIPANGGLLSVLILFRVSRSSLSENGGSSSSSSIWSSPSRSRGQTRSRRRTAVAATLWGENYEAENESGNANRDDENGGPSEGAPGSWRFVERNQRWTMPDEES